MKTKKNLLLLILGLLMTFFWSGYTNAALNGVTIPKTGKVLICHYPPGNIANVQNITISTNAINAHFWNGIAGDQHEFDELQVNGVCPYAESQKTAATAAIATATTAVTTAQATLATATVAVTTATTNLTTAKSDPKLNSPSNVQVQAAQAAVTTAQTALTQAVVAQTTAQAAVTTAQTNLTAVTATANATIAAVNTVNATVASTLADPTPSTITICHVNNGNGRVETITVSTNAWTDNATGNAHAGHADDYEADANNSCTSATAPTITTIDGKAYNGTTISTTNIKPAITGTVGTTKLDKNEAFSVTVGGATYTEGANLTLGSNKTWALTIPVTSAALIAGTTYDIDVLRGNSIHDVTINELTITCATGQAAANGVCKSQTTSPTVNSTTITQGTTTASFSGNVGTSTSLTITIANTTISNVNITPVTANGIWTYVATVPATLSVGTYAVTITGASGTTPATGTLTVQSSTGHIPTITTIDGQNYTSPTAVRTENTSPVITGNVDIDSNGALGGDSFAVSFVKSGGSTTAGTLSPTPGNSSKTWSAHPSTALTAGIYNIIATRAGTTDTTTNELKVGVDACDISVNPHVATLVLRPAVDGTHYVLGDCRTESKPNPGLYPKPQDLQPEDVVMNPLTCPTGSELNKANINNATVKRSSIANAVTVGGTINLLTQPSPIVLKYSVLSGGTLNLTGANIAADGLSATGVTLTGVTLSEAYIDTGTDFINADGSVNTNSGTTYLDVKGGVTNASGTITYEGATKPSGILTGGIITAGTNVADNSAARGTLLRGSYNVSVTNGAAILTKGRRVTGTLTGVTISNAKVTTACNNNTNPCDSIKTVVESGAISAGSFSNSPSPQAFGTVLNATVGSGNASITNTNYCFTSGKVGSRGQLNWKEVVQEVGN